MSGSGKPLAVVLHPGRQAGALCFSKKEELRMNLNLRNAIIHNVSGNTQDELKDTIVDAIQNGEEKMLPGLGVLFEVIWKNAPDQDKQDMLQALENGLK